MAAPTAGDLSAFVAREVNGDQAEAVIGIVSALARSYTRNRGWTDDVPADDLRAVILTASARMLADPSGITNEQVMGPFRVTFRDTEGGWTTSELATLNRYRERAR